MARFSIVFAILVLGAGCSPMRFSSYTGASRNWPRSPEVMADGSFAIPVYRGWPDRPYVVVGMVRCEDPNKFWNDDIVRMAASEAKQKGGSAIVLRQGSELGVLGITGATSDKMLTVSGQTTALVILWKTEEQIAIEKSIKDSIKQAALSRMPRLSGKDELLDVAIEYAQTKSGSLASCQQETLKALESVNSGRNGEYGGTWLFSLKTQQSSITSSRTSFAHGLATVTTDGRGKLVIVSASPESPFNVSGSQDNGAITGRLGIGTLGTANCDGAAVNDRVIITGQGRNADGTFESNLILLR
jgi:hypothetical protein